jgi:hypothetical protein
MVASTFRNFMDIALQVCGLVPSRRGAKSRTDWGDWQVRLLGADGIMLSLTDHRPSK